MSDYFRTDAVCIVEWPERVGDRLPRPDLALSLSYAARDAGRDVVAIAHTPDGKQCLTALEDGATTGR